MNKLLTHPLIQYTSNKQKTSTKISKKENTGFSSYDCIDFRSIFGKFGNDILQ